MTISCTSKRTNQADEIFIKTFLNALQTWSDKWLLYILPVKLKVLTISKHNQWYGNSSEICMDMKDIGFAIDEHMAVKTHIQD